MRSRLPAPGLSLAYNCFIGAGSPSAPRTIHRTLRRAACRHGARAGAYAGNGRRVRIPASLRARGRRLATRLTARSRCGRAPKPDSYASSARRTMGPFSTVTPSVDINRRNAEATLDRSNLQATRRTQDSSTNTVAVKKAPCPPAASRNARAARSHWDGSSVTSKRTATLVSNDFIVPERHRQSPARCPWL